MNGSLCRRKVLLRPIYTLQINIRTFLLRLVLQRRTLLIIVIFTNRHKFIVTYFLQIILTSQFNHILHVISGWCNQSSPLWLSLNCVLRLCVKKWLLLIISWFLNLFILASFLFKFENFWVFNKGIKGGNVKFEL